MPALFEILGDSVPEIGVTRLSVKQAGGSIPTHPRRPLKTGQRPVSSQDTSSQHSGARWSSGW